MADSKTSIGGLWLKQSKAGKKYLSGTIDGIGAVVVFKNDRKDKETQPDYRIYKSEPRKAEPENWG